MFNRGAAKNYGPSIEEVVVRLVYVAQLHMRKNAGSIRRATEVEISAAREACEIIYSLSDLCHMIVGPLSIESGKLRRERLMFSLARAWQLSPPDRRRWMLEQLDDIGFDHSLLDNYKLR
ncbi:hypothetical protein GCM10027161_50200 [Microbispora hainanensis]